MALLTSYPKILTDETMKEVAHHGNPEFPLGYYVEDIWEFDFHCVDWHWHPEVEVIYVLEGTATVLAGSGSYRLSAGTAAFLNTQVIHCFRSEGSTILPNLVFSPEIIAPEQSLLYRKFVAPVLHSGVDIQVFSPETFEDGAVLDCLREVIAHQEQSSPSEFRTVRLLMALWEAIGSRVRTEGNPEDRSLRAQAQLQRMMQYVHTHYAGKVTLEELAGEVSISKSSAMKLFRQYLHTSPIDYLISYRLKQAAKLLTTTRGSVSTIAEQTGFENVGYFCRKFKAVFSQTPSQYRRESQEP